MVYLYCLAVFFVFSLSENVVAQNSISGMVFDDNKKPVSDVSVELLDDIERLIGSRKTRNGFTLFNGERVVFITCRSELLGSTLKKKESVPT